MGSSAHLASACQSTGGERRHVAQRASVRLEVSNLHSSQFVAPGSPGAGSSQVSLAGPPSLVLVPVPPSRRSFPPPPEIRSLPGPPFRTSFLPPRRYGRCSHHRPGRRSCPARRYGRCSHHRTGSLSRPPRRCGRCPDHLGRDYCRILGRPYPDLNRRICGRRHL